MKKKIFVIALVVCIAVLSIAGSSIAYFTDTEAYTNVFTAGNVDITLSAKNAEGTMQTIDDDNANSVLNITNANVYPGQVISKDVTIKNVGSERAFVGAVITLTRGTNGTVSGDIITKEGDVAEGAAANDIPVAVTKLITGLTKSGYDVRVADDGLTIYVIKNEAIANGQTANVFTNVVIPASWDNAQMALFNNVKLNVTAYATQEVGFDNAIEALQAAFDAFDTLPAVNP